MQILSILFGVAVLVLLGYLAFLGYQLLHCPRDPDDRATLDEENELWHSAFSSDGAKPPPPRWEDFAE